MFRSGNNQGNSPWGGGSGTPNPFGAVPISAAQPGNNAFPAQTNPLFGGTGSTGSSVFGAPRTTNTFSASSTTSQPGSNNPPAFGGAPTGAFAQTTTPTFASTGATGGSGGFGGGGNTMSTGTVFGSGSFGGNIGGSGQSLGTGSTFGTATFGGSAGNNGPPKPFGGTSMGTSTPMGSAPGGRAVPFGGGSSIGTGMGTGSAAVTTATTPNLFAGAKPSNLGFGAFGAGKTQSSFATGADANKASPGTVFGRSNREPLLKPPSSTSSLSSDTTTVFSSSGTVSAPYVFGGTSAPTTTSASSFGGPAVNRALFGGAQQETKTTTASTLFGKPTKTSFPVTTQSVFSTSQTPATTAASNKPAGNVFGAAAKMTPSQPANASPFQVHPKTAPTSASTLFGKIVSAAPESTQSVFRSTKVAFRDSPTPSSGGDSGGAALFGKPSSNVFGKKTETNSPETGEASQPRASKGLFGKTKPAVTGAAKEAGEEGHPTDKPRGQTGLFGKGDQGNEPPSHESGRKRLIQRRGRNTEAEAARTGGLFGRALASATGGSSISPPRVGRRVAERAEDETRESRVSPQSTRRRSSLDDLSQHKVLTAANIPNSHNSKGALKKHFSQFGTLTKIQCIPAKKQATIFFADHESALNAKKNGRIVRPGVPPINLFWKSLTSTKVGSSPEHQETQRPARQGGPTKLFGGSSEIDSELSGMSGADDAFGVAMRTVERPTNLQSDPLAGAISGVGTKTALFKGAKVEARMYKEKSRSVSPLNRETVSPESPSRSLPRRRTSLEDVSQHKVLAARNIPTSHNNKVALKKHFSQYGTVTKLYCTPSKNQAVIHFVDHESALNAKKNGRIVRPGVPPINLFWKSLTSTKVAGFSPGGTQISPEHRDKPTREGSPKKLFSGLPDVDSELASMSGADDAFGVSMKKIERPTGLQSDPLGGAVSGVGIKTALFKGHGVKGEAGVERLKDKGKEKARSVSPLNLPLRKNRDPGGDNKSTKSRPRDDSPVPSSSGNLVPLKSLLGKRCTTAEDRVEVLEARDRALREARLAMNAGKDLATAGAIRGTCMDMCPEKERYLRQARRRLTIYEIHPESDGRGLVDHSRAVKEYSRSSADQDMPLSNELRPPEVLARTMTFILNNIIQLGGERKWSDWFEYIWSRTRSIRKDITQQQLCDQTSVKLVEQCARFHIFCAERLCEEDPAVFDEKINNENLTKCLQTLKEMYADMWTKHNQRCPNEAEFRSYMVLMNLNEGDILRETQQLREEIRQAAQVKFALNVHSALNSDNYIRFFKLVRQASFLPACILHRYFNQMRSHALLTFIMAYAIPGNTAYMQLDDLVRLLAFEGPEEARDFCEHYGLLSEDGTVAIARQTYSNPESAYPVSRAKLLIEDKMMVSAGEVINGEPLPPNEILPPTDSFDEDGRYQPDVATLQVLEDQEEQSSRVAIRVVDPPKPHVEPPAQPAPPAPRQALPYSNDAVKEVAKEIFLDVIKEVCCEMSQNLYQSCKAFLSMDAPLTEDFLNEQCQLHVREIAQEVVSEERNKREQEARARAEFSAMKERAITQLQGELTEEVITDMVQDIANEEKRVVDGVLKKESIERCTAEIIEDMMEVYSQNEANAFIHEFFQNEVEHKREMLARATAATKRLRARRFFSQWKNELAGRQRLQRSMLGFPSAPSMYSPQERVERIVPGNAGLSEEQNAVHLGQNAWLTLTPPTEIVENESELINEILRQNEEQKRKELLSRTPLNLCHVSSKGLLDNYMRSLASEVQDGLKRSKSGIRIKLYWKMALCLPQVTCEEQYHYNEWLTNKLSTSCDTLPPECHHPLARVIGCGSSDLDVHPHHSVQINVSVRLVDGTLLPSDVAEVKRERHLQATQGILYVISGPVAHDPEFWDREKLRLNRILDMVDEGDVSLLMACPPSLVRTCEKVLVPHYQHRVSFVEAVTFTKDVIDPVATKQFQSALEVLVSQASYRVPVKSEWITDYLHHGLQRFFYSKVQNSTYVTSEESCLDQVPAELVELYNAVIHHLAAVAGDKDLRNITWPPPEFTHTNTDLPDATWNNSDVLDYVHDLLVGLTLPECDVSDLEDDVSWSRACSSVWLYVEAVAGETYGTDVFLISRVRQVLKKARETFQDDCYWKTGVQEAEPTACNLPWNKIIRVCIDHKLACLNRLPPHIDLEQLEYTELRIHYDPKCLDHFMAPADWLNTTRQMPEAGVLDQSVRRAAKRKQEERDSQREHASKSSRHRTPVKNTVRVTLNPTEVKLQQVENMTHNVLNMISNEKKINDEYEKYLEDILREGDMPLDPMCMMVGTSL